MVLNLQQGGLFASLEHQVCVLEKWRKGASLEEFQQSFYSWWLLPSFMIYNSNLDWTTPLSLHKICLSFSNQASCYVASTDILLILQRLGEQLLILH